MYVSIKDKQIEKGECVTTVQCLKRNIMESQIPKQQCYVTNIMKSLK